MKHKDRFHAPDAYMSAAPMSVHWSRGLYEQETEALTAAATRKVAAAVAATKQGFLRHYWPLILIAATFGAFAYVGEMCARLQAECKTLKLVNADFVQNSMRQAQLAFDTGDFRKAAMLVGPVGLSRSDNMDFQLLRARIMECNCQFPEAANIYQRVIDHSANPPVTAETGLAFCRRMASERNSLNPPSREILYRLHDELMRRGDHAPARVIAGQLRPNIEPLRASTEAMLRETDIWAEVSSVEGMDRVDVRLGKMNPAVMELLRDLPIRSLTVQEDGVTTMGPLAGVDILKLNLSRNPLGDITAIRTLAHLSSLNLADTPIADVQSLAGLPLRELNLSRTKVSSLNPLVLCPLESLEVSGLPVRDLTPLRGLALRQLDLSRTKVDDISQLQNLPLETLHLDNTKVRDLSPLAGAKLRCLTLSNTPVKDISPLQGMPLVELDLRGCNQLTDLSPLANCNKLEKLHLPRSAHMPASLLHLPRLKIITH